MPAHVLVVDQNPVVQTTIENLLNPQNCEVTSVRDALSGLDLAYKIKPDLMIADLRMEGLMIYSFCARVRQKSFLTNIPIFLLVQPNDVYDESRLRQSGVVGFIQKPVDAEKLNEALKPYLSRFAGSAFVGVSSLPARVPETNLIEEAKKSSSFSELSVEEGVEFNMDQTVFDKTMMESKKIESVEKPDESVNIDDLLGWSQTEVSPFSEVITPPLPEETPLSGLTQLMEEKGEETQLSSGYTLMEEEGVTEILQKPPLEVNKKPDLEYEEKTTLEKKEPVPTASLNGKASVAEISPALQPASIPSVANNPEISKMAQEIIEKVAWEVVPHLTEQAMKKEMIASMIEKVIWEVVPSIAEQSVKAAIKKISEEQE